MIKAFLSRLPDGPALRLNAMIMRVSEFLDACIWNIARKMPKQIAYRIIVIAFARAYAHKHLPNDVYERVTTSALTGHIFGPEE